MYYYGNSYGYGQGCGCQPVGNYGGYYGGGYSNGYPTYNHNWCKKLELINNI